MTCFYFHTMHILRCRFKITYIMIYFCKGRNVAFSHLPVSLPCCILLFYFVLFLRILIWGWRYDEGDKYLITGAVSIRCHQSTGGRWKKCVWDPSSCMDFVSEGEKPCSQICASSPLLTTLLQQQIQHFRGLQHFLLWTVALLCVPSHSRTQAEGELTI